MRFNILFIASICLLIAVTVYASPSGKSKICNDIGYLSTSCKDAEMIPMEYYDKEVALAKAKQDVHIETHENITNLLLQKSKKEGEIEITTWFEEN